MVVYRFETVIRGLKPLLMHNPQCILEYQKWKETYGTKTKPPPDVEAKWGVYQNKEGLFLPAEYIEGAIGTIAKDSQLEGRKKSAYDLIRRSVEVVPLEIPLLRDGERVTDYEVFIKSAQIQRSRIHRARPRINLPWEARFKTQYNLATANIPVNTVKKMVIDSGEVGIGDWRPKFGKYEVEIVKVEEI